MSARELSLCTEQAMEAIALNRDQQRRLYNPSPEVDSLVERIISLATYKVPADVLRELTDDVLAVLKLNATEREHQLHVTGSLDTLSRVYRARERDITAQVQDDLTIRGLARSLRKDLATIAAGPLAGAKDFTAAGLRVGDIVRRTPADRLLGKSLRHELGERPHALLAEFVRQGARS